jgi:hypothetical protein
LRWTEVTLEQWPLRGRLNQRGGGGRGGGPVSGAAGGCLLEAASAAGNLFIAPHNTRALGGAALAGQKGKSTNTVRAGPSRRAAGMDGGSLSCARGAFASLVYTPPLYTNCSNCASMFVGGSRTGPPRAAMTAWRAAQQAAFCFFVRPRRRVAGLKRAAGRAADGCWLGGGGGRGGGGGAALRAFLAGCFIPPLLKARTFYLYFGPAAPPGVAG